MNHLRKLLIAYKIMKNQGIKYSPFIKRCHGRYVEYSENYPPQIKVNPFCKNFWEIFSHEVGHHLCRRNSLHKCWYNTLADIDLWFGDYVLGAVVKEEAKASICAIRLSNRLGVPIDANKLLSYFYTYTGPTYAFLSEQGLDREKITDLIYGLVRQVENNLKNPSPTC